MSPSQTSTPVVTTPLVNVPRRHLPPPAALIVGVQARGNIRVALMANSYREAEDAIFDRRAFAVLGIPPIPGKTC
jgi:hypothetical protein